jgi:hypothetical protein
MAGKYELWLTDDYGRRIADSQGHSYLKQFHALTASRALGEIGRFTLRVPLSFDKSLLKPDRMIQVWRRPTGGRLGLWRIYFLRRWRFISRGGNRTVELAGPCQNELLRRRIVAAYTGSAQAKKSDFADDMMKAFVSEALSDAAAPTPTAGTRAWPSLTVQADLGDGPSIDRSVEFNQLLTTSGGGVLTSIAKASREAGTEVFYDVRPKVLTGSSISFEFHTWTINEVRDVSDSVVFDESAGNMIDTELEYDYSEEQNYIYSAGQGEAADRNVQQVYDEARYSVSQWARCEGYMDAASESTNAGVIALGRSRLAEGRPKIRFSGTPVDTRGTRFGKDWDIGYRVGAKAEEITFDHLIRAVTLVVDEDGRDEIRTRLEYES